ncbi:VIT-domain-containing protein [Annulohypoxylon maeteangense]|uniref:VIT-domain-containing protein n=1 Tax=Annulohypoxylon maeteangense TaxID=1927788 RepID=UPI0020074B04|nr:VIT-domain-containing protein [Annulohypoxylon maeteangense]KAI0887810.1 VIT-domain-containing protein [Annulohypoxylon maeteangense]
MAIFSAGIVWDPREPLPAELGGQPLVSHYTHSLSQKIPQKIPSGDDKNSHLNKELPGNIFKEPTRNLLSPLSVSINGSVVDDAARVTVSQVFWNNADITIPKASYIFPLPSGCTVTSFSCRIGRDKTIRAKVKPKAEAREAFRQAVAAERTAALLEQNTPELFTASLGNIPVDTRLEAELTYVTLLKRQFSQEKNITEFSIPTAIASRYGNAPPDIRGNLSGETPNSFTLQLEVLEAEKILQIKSDTHKIQLNQGLGKVKASNWVDLSGNSESPIDSAVVNLDSSVGFLHEDFILTIETNSPSKVDHAHAWLESHSSLENQKAMMITIPSSLMQESNETPKTGEVIFLVDRSGSMQDKIEAVKSSLQFFLKGIPVGRKFNILSFGSSFEKLWHKSQDYSSNSLQLALDHVANLKADMGGTELLPALTEMVASRDTSCPCDMIVLTDGEVWRLEETLALVQETRTNSQGAVRFFSLGIGAHVSHALVQGIASRGGGYSEVISKASTGGWEDRVVAMLKAALTAHVKTLGIKLNGKDNYGQLLASPAEFGDLNPFQGNRVYLLSKPDLPLDELRSVVVETIKSNGETESTTIAVTKLMQPDTMIHNLGVKSIVDDVGYPGKQTLSLDQATELACRFSLASKWTSFFLEQDNPAPKVEDKNIQVHDSADDLDDLLQPRGIVRDETSDAIRQLKRYPANANYDNEFLESMYDPCIEDFSQIGLPAEMRSMDFDNTCSISRTIVPIGYSESKREAVYYEKKSRKALLPVFNWRSLIPSIGTSRARRKMASGRLFHKMRKIIPESDNSDELDKNTVDLQREFVAKLLSYQNFNGSFDADTKSILGSSMAKAVQEIQEHALKSSIIKDYTEAGILTITAIVVVLLERDLQACKDLWGLMAMKATNYVSSLASDESKRNGLYDFAKKQLTGKTLEMEGAKARSTNQATAGVKDPDDQQPERSVVKVAPFE